MTGTQTYTDRKTHDDGIYRASMRRVVKWLEHSLLSLHYLATPAKMPDGLDVWCLLINSFLVVCLFVDQLYRNLQD